MSPVDLVFLVVWLLFGVIGIVRGVAKELGVTVMLLLALLLLELMGTMFLTQITQMLNQVFGMSPSSMPAFLAIFSVALLMLVTFLSYEGVTLVFPVKGSNWFFSLGVGLINGYLFAGSVWYYLQTAGWPLLNQIIKPVYTELNQNLIKLMPPAIFSWQVLLLMVVFLLILRIWK
jgi:hypothetical protein